MDAHDEFDDAELDNGIRVLTRRVSKRDDIGRKATAGPSVSVPAQRSSPIPEESDDGLAVSVKSPKDDNAVVVETHATGDVEDHAGEESDDSDSGDERWARLRRTGVRHVETGYPDPNQMRSRNVVDEAEMKRTSLQRQRQRRAQRRRRRRLKINRRYIFLPGEKVLLEGVDCELRCGHDAIPIPARLAITDYALVFGAAPNSLYPVSNQYAVVPLLSLEKVSRSDDVGTSKHGHAAIDGDDHGDDSDDGMHGSGGGGAGGGGSGYDSTTKVKVECKDTREFVLHFADDTIAEGFVLQSCWLLLHAAPRYWPHRECRARTATDPPLCDTMLQVLSPNKGCMDDP
mgnify:FL=1